MSSWSGQSRSGTWAVDALGMAVWTEEYGVCCMYERCGGVMKEMVGGWGYARNVKSSTSSRKEAGQAEGGEGSEQEEGE